MATTTEIAVWMLAELERVGTLTQAEATEQIRANFGAEHAPGGKIRKTVLQAFNRLGAGQVVWNPHTHAWRRRNAHDPPGRGRTG